MRARRVVMAGLLAGAAIGLVKASRARARFPEVGGGRPLTVTTPDGVRLAVEVDEPEAPAYAIVFAHGWVLNRHSWHFQREGLGAGKAMLVCYDQRGHGSSSAGPYDCCTIEQLGDDLHAVIEAVVPPGLPVILVGHSMGGMTIMGLAAGHPSLFGERVVGVALLSTSAGELGQNTFGLPGPLARLVPRLTPVVLDGMLARADLLDRRVRLRARTNLPITRYIAFGRKPDGSHVRFVNDMIAATPTEVMVGFFHGILAHDKLAVLEALSSVETVVIVGERDRLTPPSHARRIAGAVRGARLLVVPEAGHMVGMERADAVNQALSELAARAVVPA